MLSEHYFGGSYLCENAGFIRGMSIDYCCVIFYSYEEILRLDFQSSQNIWGIGGNVLKPAAEELLV